MKHLFIILLALLTCATLHAQTVIVKGTSAGAVRGTIVQTPTSVLTNLVVTGTLDPDATGTNYVQIADYNEAHSWSNSVIGSVVGIPAGGSWILHWTNGVSGPYWVGALAALPPTGTYNPKAGSGSTGTATVAYWYQTNYSSVVTVRGKATP